MYAQYELAEKIIVFKSATVKHTQRLNGSKL